MEVHTLAKKVKAPIYTEDRKGFWSRLFKFLVKFLYGKYTYIYHDEKPEEPSIFIANHTYYIGPLVMQYQYPGNIRTWSNSKFFTKETSLTYMRYKFSDGKRCGKFISFLIAIINPIVVWFYSKNLNAIPVYHDFDVAKTFRDSSETLANGSHIAIYPEQVDAKFNGVLSEFATGFTYTAQTHHRKTGECVKFYPIYLAQELKEVHFGKPIKYDPEIPMKEQSLIITNYLFDNIMELHSKLPPHKIVPMFKEEKPKKKPRSKKK